jgi:hypothetical protein
VDHRKTNWRDGRSNRASVDIRGCAAGKAGARAIAGNRLFPGTPAFDDPGTLDELAIEAVTNRHPAADNNPVDDRPLAWSFARLLTPDIASGADGSLV